MSAAPLITAVADVERIVEWAQVMPVFPCSRDKRPLTSNGFHDASQDEQQIRAWWRRHPDALVGVPTGLRTGLVVIDYDPHKTDAAGREWVEAHTATLTGTRTHTTQRGGKHWIFQNVDAEYSSGKDVFLDGKQRRGIDIRADGGYVIWWPMHGGQVVNDDAAPLPPGFLADRRRLLPKDRTIPAADRRLLARARDWAQDRARVIAALAYVDPNDRDVWVRVGLAIHQASKGDDDGFAVWHAWSCGGMTGEVPAAYVSENDCRYNWQCFNKHAAGKDRIVTLGTVFALAKAGGYEPDVPPPTIDVPQPGIDTYTEADIPPDLAPEEWSEPKPKKASARPQRIVLRHISEIVAEKREAEWLIYEVLEQRVLAVIAGQRGTFKSFIALDWLMRAALHGFGVVLLSGEGAGLDRRVDAWHRTFAPNVELSTIPVVALERAINFNLDETYSDFEAAVLALPFKPAAVLIDTLSKFSAGLDENDNAMVAAFLARLAERIREGLGCTVVMVAHAGHADPKRPRGASALMANPDAEYIVERPDPTGMFVTVSRERFKDTPSLPALVYQATPVDLGRRDKYSKPVTSLVMQPFEEAIPVAPKKGQGRNQTAAVTLLREWARANPNKPTIGSDEIKAALKLDKRQRRHEVIKYLVDIGVLTPAVGGHTIHREALE